MCKDGDSKQLGKCQVEGVCYSLTCKGCKANNKASTYIGETSRTAYERGLEHIRGHENEEEDNCLWKHSVEDHRGTK